MGPGADGRPGPAAWAPGPRPPQPFWLKPFWVNPFWLTPVWLKQFRLNPFWLKAFWLKQFWLKPFGLNPFGLNRLWLQLFLLQPYLGSNDFGSNRFGSIHFGSSHSAVWARLVARACALACPALAGFGPPSKLAWLKVFLAQDLLAQAAWLCSNISVQCLGRSRWPRGLGVDRRPWTPGLRAKYKTQSQKIQIYT